MAKRPVQHASITAAARRVDLTRPAPRLNRVNWQEDAWSAFDDVPEVKQFVLWRADQMAKLRLFVGIRLTEDDREPPVPLDAPAVEDSGVNLAPETIVLIQRELAAFRGDAAAGQSGLLRRMEQCLEVAGECHLVGFNVLRPNAADPLEPAFWRVVSTRELVVRDEQFVYGETPAEVQDQNRGRKISRESDDMFRVWEPHGAFYGLADSALRACLADSELLVALSNQLLAETRSRSSAGFMTWPSELAISAPGPTVPANVDPGGGERDDDPIMSALMAGLIEPAVDPSHPAAVVPLVIRGNKEALTPDVLRTFAVARPFDEHLDDRIEKRVLRLARGLSAPPEQVIGFDATTFANAKQIDQDIWEDYLQPRARFLVDAITAGYLVSRLTRLNLPDEIVTRLCVWYDPSDVIDAPDTSGANADAAYDRNEISGQAYRNARGFTEDDKPTVDEVLERFALRRGVVPAELTAFLLERLAEQAEAGPLDLSPYAVPGSSSAQAAPPGGAATVLRLLAAAAGDVRPKALRGLRTLRTVSTTTTTANALGTAIGRRLVAIDRDLRTRVLVAANAAMVRALEKAAARLRTKAPDRAAARRLSNTDIGRVMGRQAVTATLGDDVWAGSWDALGVDYLRWAYAARDEAVSIVAPFSGMTQAQVDMLTTRLTASIEESWSWLADTLSKLADDHLFGALTSSAATLGEADPTLKVGAGVARQAVARAGGTSGLDDSRGGAWVTVTTGGEDPGGLAFGDGIREGFGDAGGTIEGYVWDYGPGMRQTFEPHLRLDGVEFVNFDDDVLANNLGWPEFDFFIPGDHNGCGCDAIPTLLSREDFPEVDSPGWDEFANEVGLTPEEIAAIEDLAAAEKEVRVPLPEELPSSIVDYQNAAAEKAYGPVMADLDKLHRITPGVLDKTEIIKGGKSVNKGGHFSARAKSGTKPRRKAGESVSEYSNRVMEFWKSPGRPEIKILNRGDGSEKFSFLHEFGHRIDVKGLNANYVDWHSWKDTEAVTAFMRAAQETDTIAEARNHFSDRAYVAYFRSRHEVWARAYSQWAANELGGEYRVALEAVQKGWGRYQWTDEEFKALAPLIRDILKERGMID